MKDYSEKADSNLVGKLGFRQEETLPFSNLDDRFCTCGDGSTAHTRYCINAMENEINTTRYSRLRKHIFWQK